MDCWRCCFYFLLDIANDRCHCSFGEDIDHGRYSRGSSGGNLRGVRGGWFIDDAIGLLWANDGLCYVSDDEGAEIVDLVVEMLEHFHLHNKSFQQCFILKRWGVEPSPARILLHQIACRRLGRPSFWWYGVMLVSERKNQLKK